MSPVTRNEVFGVFNKYSGCRAIEDGERLECLDLGGVEDRLYYVAKIKTLISCNVTSS